MYTCFLVTEYYKEVYSGSRFIKVDVYGLTVACWGETDFIFLHMLGGGKVVTTSIVWGQSVFSLSLQVWILDMSCIVKKASNVLMLLYNSSDLGNPLKILKTSRSPQNTLWVPEDSRARQSPFVRGFRVSPWWAREGVEGVAWSDLYLRVTVVAAKWNAFWEGSWKLELDIIAKN